MSGSSTVSRTASTASRTGVMSGHSEAITAGMTAWLVGPDPCPRAGDLGNGVPGQGHRVGCLQGQAGVQK
jgi:hypothetical protein